MKTTKFHETFAGEMKKQKMSQAELARRIGVNPEMISKYARGKVTPTIETLLAIADALHVTCDYLLTGDENPRNWIRKTERMPDPYQEVYCAFLSTLQKKRFVARGYVDAGGNLQGVKLERGDILRAWMPIPGVPDPYREDDEE